MRKLTALLLALVMVFSMAGNAFAASFVPSVSSSEVQAGEDVTVTLSLDEALEHMISLECYVYFNPNHFELKEGAIGEDNSHLEFFTEISEVFEDSADEHHYSVNFVDFKSKSYTINAGVFYTLTFTAKQDLTEEQATQFKLVTQDGRNLVEGTSETVSVPLTAEVLDVTIKPAAPAEYDITIGSMENGSVTASKEKAAENEEITLTVTPADGYELETLTVMAGETEVTVTDNKFTMPASAVTVNATFIETSEPAVTISLDKTELTLTSPAESYQLTLTVTGANAEDVVWATSDENVATITAYPQYSIYQITAIKEGECDITATVGDVTATCHVTVDYPVATLPFALSVGDNDLEATFLGYEDCIKQGGVKAAFEVTVPADATTMLIVPDSTDGMLVLNEADGTTLAENKSMEYEVDLSAGYEKLCLRDATTRVRYHLTIKVAEPETPAVTITLNETDVELSSFAGSVELTATVTGSEASVVWATTDESVAHFYDISGGIYVEAVGPGECDITATVDGVTATCHVTVVDPVIDALPYTITVDGTDVEAVADGTEICDYGFRLYKFKVTVPADAKTMHLSYDNESAYVFPDHGEEYLLEGGADCDVDLTKGYQVLDLWDAEAMDLLFHLHIEYAEPEKIPVNSVGLSETAIEMALNSGIKQLYATVTPDNATNNIVTWASSDESVVTIVDGGNNMCIVYTAGAGEAVITATADGVSATCNVTVYDPATQFPYTLTVNGEDLDVTANGTTSSCLFGNQSLFEVTVPADATEMLITFDGESMTVMDDSAGRPNIIAQNVTEYTLDLTKGYAEIHLADNDNNVHRHVKINVAEPEAPVAPGYTFATSADVTAENGGTATVHVKITGHSDETVTSYNAYDITLTFDSDKLEYVSYDGAVKSDGGSVTVEGNEIRIVGCGEDKNFGTEIVALTFKTKEEGTADVTITKVQVSDKEEAVTENIPEASAKHAENDANADTTPDVSVVIVPFTVTKPDFISGEKKVLYGGTYTFSYTDTTNYTYSGLTVKVDGTEVTPSESNGVYTITNVTGAVEITAIQTANSYDVTKPENVGGPEKATYGDDYEFTVTPSANMLVDSIKVTLTGSEEEIAYTSADGKYIIAGSKIAGPITITVTEKPVAQNTTITFEGIATDEIQGGSLTVTVPVGETYTFQLLKTELYTYTAKVGETVLTESAETAGSYTIPGELVVANGITVQIEKNEIKNLAVDVNEYITLDGNAMFLVTAKWGDKVLAYGDETMIYSSKYTVTGQTQGAYCWLVLSTDELNTVDAVKAAAQAAIVEAAEGATATAVKYNYDINGTTKVDVNDAQLVYDMYNASYMEFTQNLPMLKFLEADMETDAKLDTKDVAAIISYIVSGSAN